MGVKRDPRMPQPNDAALLATIHAGPPEAGREALRTLYERHAAAVHGFLVRLEPDVTLCDDLLQDCFLAARRQAGRFREGSARPWLLSLAAGRLRDTRRAGRRRRAREAEVARPEAERDTEASDLELERGMAELPERERAALHLRYHAQLTVAEASTVLGVSPRTVKSWAAAGLARLRKRLEDDA